MDVDAEYYRFIVGRGGETKKRIEQDTGATITIPSKYQQDNGISTFLSGHTFISLVCHKNDE